MLTLKETRKAFAEYCGEPESKTGWCIDSLGEFIAREVAAGYRLNFGPFGVSLKMLGGFKAAVKARARGPRQEAGRRRVA